jgi:hypothetical protein
MTLWELDRDGDRIEKRWWPYIKAGFPQYQDLWSQHVVPLTGRPEYLYVRESIPPPLAKLATVSYSVFVHLAGCHQQLDPSFRHSDLFATEGVYIFYSRLYSAQQALRRFITEVADVQNDYNGTLIRDPLQWLKFYGKGTLEGSYREFDKRIGSDSYRAQQVHDWGFPVLEGNIPGRPYFQEWVERLKEKGLGALATFLNEKDSWEKFKREFVNAIDQARDDLRFAEETINDIWKVALDELNALKDAGRYKADQTLGKGESLRWQPVSSAAAKSSG